jgi:hypothetical protein
MKTKNVSIKMRLVRTALSLVLLTAAVCQASAQNFREDLKEMATVYANLDRLEMEVEINVYATHESTISLQQQLITVKKLDNEFCYRAGEFEALFTSSNMLLIDHEEHSIHRSKMDQMSKQQMRKMMGEFNPEEMLPKDVDAVFDGIEAGMKKYTIQFPAGKGVETAEMYLNRTTLRLEKIVYYYDREQHENASKVQVIYARFNTNPTFSKDTFSEKRYLTRRLSNGSIFLRYQPTEKYANYQVTNQE